MNKIGPKTHIAGVEGLSKFDSPWIYILFTGNTKFLFHSIPQNFLLKDTSYHSLYVGF